MKSISTFCAVLLLGVLAVILPGCNTEREEGKGERAVLKPGQQVSADMVGWVAVPNTEPKAMDHAGTAYAVMAANNVVPPKMDGWVAMPGALFTKMTDVKVETPAAANVERWLLKPEGKSVPKEKTGWVAVPNSSPTVEASGSQKGLELATLHANNIVPKEMNGWVAVSADTLAKLVEKYMQTGKGSKVSKD